MPETSSCSHGKLVTEVSASQQLQAQKPKHSQAPYCYASYVLPITSQSLGIVELLVTVPDPGFQDS